MGVLYAARGHGLAVPRDLSVIGVDGHDFAYLFDLTTVSQPVRDQGRIAARLLLEQVNSAVAPAAVGGVRRVQPHPPRHDRPGRPAAVLRAQRGRPTHGDRRTIRPTARHARMPPSRAGVRES